MKTELELIAPLVRDELRRILSSEQFANSVRLQRFLRFVIEAMLKGDADLLKESVIGVQVFGRDTDFDPKADPIVRVTARRLRQKLEEFYSGPPSGNGILIQIPRGGYVPEILAQPSSEPLEAVTFDTAPLEIPSLPGETASEERQARPVSRASRRWVWLCLAASLAIAGFIAWRLARLPSFTGRVSRFTIDLPPGQLIIPYYGNNLAFSPDGRFLVYVARENATLKLFLHELKKSESHVIPGSDWATAPFFSPDGQSVVAYAPGVLRRFFLAGGFTDIAEISPSFTLFGGLWDREAGIYFNNGTPGTQVEGSSSVFHVSLQPGRSAERMSWPPFNGSTTSRSEMIQQVLPDGKGFIESLWNPELLIAAVSADGKTRKILTDRARGGLYLPTGHLAFWRDGNLMAAPMNLSSLELTGPPVVVLNSVGFSGHQGPDIAVSSDGTLAYVRRASQLPDRKLVWVDHSGHETPLPIPPGPIEALDISRDGKNLLFTRYDPEHNDWTLWSYSLVDGSARQLFRPEPHRILACWSPDGRRVVFSSSLEDAHATNLFLASSDGSGPAERLTSVTSAGNVPQTWSPDGKWLLYLNGMQPRTKSDIWALPVSGNGRPAAVVQTPDYDTAPSVSPDGRWLAYTMEISGTPHIFVQAFPTPGARPPVSPGIGSGPLWDPSGKQLYYRAGLRMLAVDVTAADSLKLGEPSTLFQGDYMYPDIWMRNGLIAPDGRFLLMKEQVDPNEGKRIQVVVNWFSELNSTFHPHSM